MLKYITIAFILSIISLRAFPQSDSLGYRLIKAAEEGKTKRVIALLKQKADIDFRDANGGTALFYATENHHLDIVKILVYNGADMDIPLYDGFTPLMSAAFTGDFDIADYLAYSGATLDATDQFGLTALHYAVAQKDYYIADMLLFYGAGTKILSDDNTSPLLVASVVGDTAIARLLIEKGADIDRANNAHQNPLSIAIMQNDTAMFDLLINAGADLSRFPVKNYPADAWSLLNNNLYAFRKLKPAHPGPEATGNKRTNPLIIAYALGDSKIVKGLKKEGYKSGIAPYFNSLVTDVAFSFNNKDLFISLGVAAQDVKYKTRLGIRLGSRPHEKSIIEERDYGFVQLWEHRHFFELNLAKYFRIPLGQGTAEPFVEAGFQWMWGYYNGLSRKLDDNFVIVPRLGLRFCYQNLVVSAVYAYTPYGLYDISPHKFEIGIGLRFSKIKKPKPYKLLWL